MEDEPKKYDQNNPQELTRDLYKKFRFETLVSLAQGKLILVPKTITDTELPFKDEKPAHEPSLFEEGNKSSKPNFELVQAEPQVDLNTAFSPRPSVSEPEPPPISEEDRLHSLNPCAPPSTRISS